jgi:hypothetical protein
MKAKDKDKLIDTLAARFEKNAQRHKAVKWADVLKRLEANPDAIDTLGEMESTGGEPDVIGQDKKTGKIIFCDCAAESPAGRRSLCFDKQALDSRKANKPKGSAMEMASKMGIELLSEADYRALQELGEFDTKTSSWIATPENIRSLGGALFCDRRFATVFVYHNGAESYYAARGFRGSLRV